MNRKQMINKITKIGILSALSIILYYLKFNLPAIFPSFLEVNFSMLPALLGTFALGPLEGAIIVIIRFLLKLMGSSTVAVGEIADLVIGLMTVLPAGFIYMYNKTKKGGLIATIVAAVCWTFFGAMSNLFTIPLYLELYFKGNVNILVGALSIIPGINADNYMSKYILFGALPFNAMLAILVCTITYFIYKSVSKIFKKDFFGTNKIKCDKSAKGKVLVMVDSFKGSMTSLKAGRVIQEELVKKGYCVNVMPISDGGEGFLEVFKQIYNLEYMFVNVNDAFFNEHSSRYLYDKENNTAYVELAECCGIGNIKKEDLNPFIASSYGLGEQIKKIIEKHNPKKIVVGIGGSASNDGGSGMLEALGAIFYDQEGKTLEHMNNELLASIAKIHVGSVRSLFQDIEVEIYSDVTNPLLGESGATYIFAPQKGAKEEDLAKLEANMVHYKEIVEEQVFGMNNLTEAGEGAAGGVGFAFNRIVRAKMGTGSIKILDLIDFKSICNEYDIIITGEGKFDSQSLEGKVITGITNYNPKRLIIVCGKSEINDNIFEIYSVVPNIATIEESLNNPEESLAKLIKSINI